MNHTLCSDMGFLARGLGFTRQEDLVKGAQALAAAALRLRFWMLGVEKPQVLCSRWDFWKQKHRDGTWGPGCLLWTKTCATWKAEVIELDRGEGDQQPPWEVLEPMLPIRAAQSWVGRPGPLCPRHFQLLYMGCPERKGHALR